MKTPRILLTCAAFLSLLCPAFAAVGAKVAFPDFSSGHVYGDKITAADLRGKVVFFEYWGINCPPCRAAMPHLIELQKKYGNKGFIVIGSHVQFMTPQVKEYLKENKVNFPIYEHKSLPQAPCPGGIPYSVLVGGDGRIIAEGYPASLYDKVPDAVAKASKGYPILDGVELSKYKSLEKTLVAGAGNVENKVEGLRAAAAEGDAEARSICEAYDNWLSGEKTRITSLCSKNPLEALPAINALKKSVPSVTEFDEQAQEIKSNPVYQQLANVQKGLNTLQKRQADGKRVSKGNIKSLQKMVAELRGKEGAGVEELCDSFESELEAMSESLEESKKAKKEKKDKKSKKKSGSNSYSNR